MVTCHVNLEVNAAPKYDTYVHCVYIINTFVCAMCALYALIRRPRHLRNSFYKTYNNIVMNLKFNIL